MPLVVPPRAVAFDLDGTLVDSRRDIAAAVNAVRLAHGLPPLDLAAVVANVGRGARRLMRGCLPPSIEDAAFEAAFADFLDRYFATCTVTTRPYPGIPEALDALAPLPLAVLTNKPERHTAAVLHGLGMAERFHAVLGGDSLPVRKPDPSGLRAIAATLGVEPSEIVLVGDSAVDGQTAAAAGAPFALVRWGYGDEEELAAIAPDVVVEHPGELADALGPTRRP